MEMFEAALEQLEVQLEQWREKLEALAARADESNPIVKVDSNRRLDDLRVKYQAARSTLDELKTADREKMSNEANGAWSTVERAFFRAH